VFVLVGLSHKTAPLEVREKAFIPESMVGECVRRLRDRELIESGVMLSTCNRTELYAMSAQPAAGDRLLEAFAWWPHELSFETWRRYAYQCDGEEAIAHLFRVAGGFESMVLGEGQVLGQLKEALIRAGEAETLDPELQIILRGAIRAGKRVRHETDLGRGAVSVAHAAVAQARTTLGTLRDRGVLLVGAGPMSEVALRLLRNQGVRDVFIASRSLDGAQRIARGWGAAAVDVDTLDEIVDRVDLILSSSSAPGHLFDAGRVQALQDRRAARPLMIVDIAVPRDIDPAAVKVPGVHLFNIDDLQAAADQNIAERRAALPRAEAVLAEELSRTAAALRARAAAPVVAALVDRVAEVRDAELARALARIPEADEHTRAAMRALADGLTAKLVHGPIRQLRESPDPRLDALVLSQAFGFSAGDPSDG
jgi:glutamyl-tRNA reductase